MKPGDPQTPIRDTDIYWSIAVPYRLSKKLMRLAKKKGYRKTEYFIRDILEEAVKDVREE